MTAVRYPLAPDRALVVSQVDGLVVLGVRDPGDVPISGPLAIRETDVGAFIAAVTEATGAELAGDMERIREVLRAQPGIAGYDHLRRALTGSMVRRRAAVQALRDAGEVVDQGEPSRPRLYLVTPKAVYSPSRAPQVLGMDVDPNPRANTPGSAVTLRVTHAPGTAAAPAPEAT